MKGAFIFLTIATGSAMLISFIGNQKHMATVQARTNSFASRFEQSQYAIDATKVDIPALKPVRVIPLPTKLVPPPEPTPQPIEQPKEVGPQLSEEQPKDVHHRRHEEEQDICTRHGMRKVWLRGGKSWRCR